MLTTSFRCKESGFATVGSPRNYPKTTRSPARSSMVELPDGDPSVVGLGLLCNLRTNHVSNSHGKYERG